MLKQTLDHADWDLHRTNLRVFFERELGPYCAADQLVESVIAKAFQDCDDGASNSQSLSDWLVEEHVIWKWLERIAWDFARMELGERRQRYALLKQLGQTMSELGWQNDADQLLACPAGDLGMIVNQFLAKLQMPDCSPSADCSQKSFIRYVNRCQALSEHFKEILKKARRQIERRDFKPTDRHFLTQKLNEFTVELQKPDACPELLDKYLKLMRELDGSIARQLQMILDS